MGEKGTRLNFYFWYLFFCLSLCFCLSLSVSVCSCLCFRLSLSVPVQSIPKVVGKVGKVPVGRQWKKYLIQTNS